MNKKSIILTVGLFLLLGTACDNTSKEELDAPYVCTQDQAEKEKWIEDKIAYLEKTYDQKVLSYEEDDEFITFILETDYMTSKVQFEKASYSKNCE